MTRSAFDASMVEITPSNCVTSPRTTVTLSRAEVGERGRVRVDVHADDWTRLYVNAGAE